MGCDSIWDSGPTEETEEDINQKKWDLRFLKLAEMVAGWSKDPSTQVGAVLVDDDRRVLSVGYNGFPRGVEDADYRLKDRETKYAFIVHAEVNAIFAAGSLARGATLYVWPTFTDAGVCNECAKVVIQAGVGKIKILAATHDEKTADRWSAKGKVAEQMLKESKVYVEKVYVD